METEKKHSGERERGFKILKIQPWLVCLSGLNTSLLTERSPVRFPVRVHAWVAGQVPGGGVASNQSIFLSVSFSLPLSLKINEQNL